MRGSGSTIAKFGIFAVVMVMLTVFLFLIFGQYRTGAAEDYSAVFTDVSRLHPGDTVRVAGVRVGTVESVSVEADRRVVVEFNADNTIELTTGTRAAIRFLNLTGDRYLELLDGPGSTRLLTAGSQIPVDRTSPALDLDLLLSGFKPVIQGLNPQEVNAFTMSLIEVFQGQGGTLDSLLARTSSFSNSLADNNQVIEQLIDNVNTVLATLAEDGDEFSGALDRLQRLVKGLSDDRDPIGTAIERLEAGTASIADLLAEGRAPLAGTVDELNRLAPLLDEGKDVIDNALQRAPGNYRKLARTGAYGAFFNYYICGIAFRVSDLQGRTATFPWIKQENGRCAEP